MRASGEGTVGGRTAHASRASPRPCTHPLRCARCAENLEQLQAERADIAAAEENLQLQASEERARVDELRAELERMTAQESKLPPEQQRLTQQAAHLLPASLESSDLLRG